MQEYLQMLIWTMLFVVIVEMVFPSSDIKKYLKLVLGFIVLYIIASPIVDVITKSQLVPGDSVEDYVKYYQSSLGQEVIYSDFEEEKESQLNGMVAIYTSQIEEQVKQLVESEVDIEVTEVSAQTILQDQQFGVETLEIVVARKEAEEAMFAIEIGDKSESIALSDANLEKEIKNCINNFYNWDNTNIYIIVQDN